MRIRLAICGLFVMMMMPIAARAAGVWTAWGKVATITDYGQGAGITGLSLPNPASCPNTGMAWVKYSLSDEQRRKLTQVVYEAFLSGKDLQVKIDPVECVDNSPSFYGVSIR